MRDLALIGSRVQKNKNCKKISEKTTQGWPGKRSSNIKSWVLDKCFHPFLEDFVLLYLLILNNNKAQCSKIIRKKCNILFVLSSKAKNQHSFRRCLSSRETLRLKSKSFVIRNWIRCLEGYLESSVCYYPQKRSEQITEHWQKKYSKQPPAKPSKCLI